MTKPRYDAFFAYARARHEIYVRRAAGRPRSEWTRDHILSQYRFTNVFRELDKTTEWFRKNVRAPLEEQTNVMLATVLFRMTNRIEVGEAMFRQLDLDGWTAFDRFRVSGVTSHLKRATVSYVGKKGPFVTGAYIITGTPGRPKLDGVLDVVGGFARKQFPFRGEDTRWSTLARHMIDNPGDVSLEEAWRWFAQVPHLGKFHSYEIVTDLRHTSLLDRAPDIMTWANVGPGAARGLNRVYGRAMSDRGKREERVSGEQMLDEMREMLAASRFEQYWPQVDTASCGDGAFDARMMREHETRWPAWEMRDVEHTLCEFDKYERVRLGHGRPRGVYR